MKNVLYLILFSIVLACGPSKEEELSLEERDDQEVIRALKELKSQHFFKLADLEACCMDKSNPRLIAIIQKPCEVLSNACRTFDERCKYVLENDQIELQERNSMIWSAQELSLDMIQILTKEEFVRPVKSLDSNEFYQLIKKVLPLYRESYDTIIIQRIAENYLCAKDLLSGVKLNLTSEDRIKVLLAQNKVLRELGTLTTSISGCNAAYANTGFEIFAKKIDSLSTDDSITLLVRHTMVLDVLAADIKIEGVPGIGWVQDEKYYYRFSSSNVKDRIRGRMSFKSKSGQLRHKDFETIIYK